MGAGGLADARHLDQAAALLLPGPEIPGRQRQAEHLSRDKAAFGQALHHARIREREAGRAYDLFDQQGRLALDLLPGGDATGREVNGRLMHGPRFAHRGDGTAREFHARSPGQDRGFLRFVEIDGVEAGLWSNLSVRLEQFLDMMNLTARQRIERMRGLRVLRRGGERWKKQEGGKRAFHPDREFHARLL